MNEIEKNQSLLQHDDWEFPSHSNPNKTYQVKWKKYGGKIILSCNCPVWIFNQRGDRTCSHTDEVQSEIGTREMPIEMEHLL